MLTIEEMELYHTENPHIYEAFEKFTFQAISSGRKYFGSQAIAERIRWYSQIEAKTDIYKINDHQTPYYARLFEKNHHQHKGFFRKRKSIADGLK